MRIGLSGVLSVVLASVAALPAQTTWIVDASGGPGSSFTDLPAAFAVASPGDTLIVRAGTYTPVITSRGLTVLGEPGAILNFDPYRPQSFVLVDLPASQKFVMKGFATAFGFWHFPLLHVLRARGVVHLDRMVVINGQSSFPVFGGKGPGITVEDSDYVTIADSTIEGAPALLVTDSVVSITGTRFDGMDAFSYHEPIFPGFRAIEAKRSQLFAAQVVAEGGRGEQTIWGFHPASSAALLEDCQTIVTGDANALLSAGRPHQAGAQTPALELVGGDLTLDPTVTLVAHGGVPPIRSSGAVVVTRRVPSATATGVPPGQTVTVSLFAEAGHAAALMVGAPVVPGPTPFGALALNPFVPAGAGSVPANGRLAFSLPVPAQSNLVGATPGFQVATLDPARTSLQLSPPVVVVLH